MLDRLDVYTAIPDSGRPPRESNPPVLIESQKKFNCCCIYPFADMRFLKQTGYTQEGSNLRLTVDKTAALPTEL